MSVINVNKAISDIELREKKWKEEGRKLKDDLNKLIESRDGHFMDKIGEYVATKEAIDRDLHIFSNVKQGTRKKMRTQKKFLKCFHRK